MTLGERRGLGESWAEGRGDGEGISERDTSCAGAGEAGAGTEPSSDDKASPSSSTRNGSGTSSSTCTAGTGSELPKTESVADLAPFSSSSGGRERTAESSCGDAIFEEPDELVRRRGRKGRETVRFLGGRCLSSLGPPTVETVRGRLGEAKEGKMEDLRGFGSSGSDSASPRSPSRELRDVT